MNNIKEKLTSRNIYPRDDGEFKDLDKVINDFIIDKSIKPFFKQNSTFVTQGSCFAKNLHNFLVKNEVNSHYKEFTEAINNPIAVDYFFSSIKNNPSENESFFNQVKSSNVFVLTIGLASAWFKLDGTFIMSPFNKKNMADYMQKTLTVEACKIYLLRIFKTLYEINNEIKIVITLSPVAMNRTFEYHSAIYADCLSKSILRAAINEAILATPDNLKPIYFPSFEIVKWIGAHRGDAYGNTSGKADGNPPRDVSPHYVDAIIKSFIKHYQI